MSADELADGRVSRKVVTNCTLSRIEEMKLDLIGSSQSYADKDLYLSGLFITVKLGVGIQTRQSEGRSGSGRFSGGGRRTRAGCPRSSRAQPESPNADP